jgi:hypothetical protein
LRWQILLPSGWSVSATTGDATAVAKPAAGAISLLEWDWTTVPASGHTFTATLNVPAAQSGNVTLAAVALATVPAGTASILVKPDPLILAGEPPHSADTDRNYRISLLELTRVIELYNTRFGTVRTGCYNVQDGTEDGFATEPNRASTATVVLSKYHSADPNRDAKLSLLELTRVIELYNYRVGTLRTGQYHVQAGTEDGFAPGP